MLPHVSQAPQSCTQVEHVSPPSQIRLPHMPHGPQSIGHDMQFSVGMAHTRSPQRGGHTPQSPGQDKQVSPT